MVVQIEKERFMTVRKTFVCFALVLALTATYAFAQVTQQEQHHPSTTPPAAETDIPAPAMQGMPTESKPGASGDMPTMGGMPMMSMMQMMMGQRGMAGHVEGRIAFLKAELKITDAQQPLWNTVADAMRATARDMTGVPNCMSMMQSSSTLPEKLAACDTTMTVHLEAFRKLTSAIEPLYAALSDDQKKAADQLMIGPMGMMGMGMM
jgi:hypothetical protein